jgi:predicted RNA-binding Zn ribbon-like protein
MIKVTWEWLGMAPALDLANTVTIENGVEHDLISETENYRRWAEHEAHFMSAYPLDVFEEARPSLMKLRETLRGVLGSLSSGSKPSRALIEVLNQVSRAAPEWLELDPGSLTSRRTGKGREQDKLLALYARSGIEMIAERSGAARRCPAPSCGMFYMSSRPSQRWCSTQCGTRARVARHYSSHRSKSPS